MIEVLIVRGHVDVNIREKDGRGRSPLFQAVESNSLCHTRKLLAFGASCNLRDCDESVLGLALRLATQVGIIQALLESGAMYHECESPIRVTFSLCSHCCSCATDGLGSPSRLCDVDPA
jgi:hypothetical protein